MAPRSLFNLLLKVIGIFFIRDILEAFSHSLSVLVYFPRYPTKIEALYNLGVTLPPIILYTVFTWLLIFRTNSIIDLLKLDRSLGDQPITVNLQRSTLLTAAVIIIGGWLLVNEIPEFFRHAFYYYQERKLYVRMTRPDISYLIMSAIKILIGFMLIIWNKSIVYLIEWRRKNKLHWHWPIKKSSLNKRNKQVN